MLAPHALCFIDHDDAATRTIVDGQIQPQSYSIEENPAYTAIHTTRQGITQLGRMLLILACQALIEGTYLIDTFNYDFNPAYTLVEAPRQEQGIAIFSNAVI